MGIYKQTTLACSLANSHCSSKLFIAQNNNAGAAADFDGSKITLHLHLADAFVQNDVQGREQSSYEQ